MKKVLAALLLAPCLALLVACETPGGGEPTPEQRLATACEAYIATLNTLTSYKPSMSEGQIGTVDDVVTVVSPICEEGSQVDSYPQALAKVSQGLRQLALVEGAVTNGTQ